MRAYLCAYKLALRALSGNEVDDAGVRAIYARKRDDDALKRGTDWKLPGDSENE